MIGDECHQANTARPNWFAMPKVHGQKFSRFACQISEITGLV